LDARRRPPRLASPRGSSPAVRASSGWRRGAPELSSYVRRRQRRRRATISVGEDVRPPAWSHGFDV
jgi:hypothetical protein